MADLLVLAKLLLLPVINKRKRACSWVHIGCVSKKALCVFVQCVHTHVCMCFVCGCVCFVCVHGFCVCMCVCMCSDVRPISLQYVCGTLLASCCTGRGPSHTGIPPYCHASHQFPCSLAWTLARSHPPVYAEGLHGGVWAEGLHGGVWAEGLQGCVCVCGVIGYSWQWRGVGNRIFNTEPSRKWF